MSWLYHEKQDAALCGVHAINNLLQGSFFTEIDLMQIAQRLDAQEQCIMAEQGVETLDFIKFAAEDSGNVALDGNFSIGVLREALSSFSIVCTSINHPDMKKVAENPSIESAFLCNLNSHWFAIRKVGNNFWDLDSLHRQPKYLGELYLGVYLKQLQITNYTIFVVRGEFPHVRREATDLNWTFTQIPQGQGRTGRNEEDELSAVIAASLGGATQQLSESESIAAAIQLSLAGPSLSNFQNSQNFSSPELEADLDLEAALLLSLESPSAGVPEIKPQLVKKEKTLPPEPEEGAENGTKIAVRLPSGTRVERRFDVHNCLGDIFNWLDIQHNVDPSEGRFVLISSIPRKEYKEASKSLKELGLVGGSVLILDEIKKILL